MAFIIYREHQLEELARCFIKTIYNRPAGATDDLLAPVEVVVQTRGMAEYLRQSAAVKSKVAANLSMPFLNSFINRIFRTLYKDEYRAGALRSDQKNMQKELMRLLGDHKFIAGRAPGLKKYICEPNSHLKRWQLAGKLADLFDQYQLYRSDKLSDGTLFAPGSWQKELYNELFPAGKPGRDHFFRRLLEEPLAPEQIALLPEQVTVFGVGALPPVYLDIFVKLSEYIDVHFFYLTPCMEYWSEQLSRPERKRLAWTTPDTGNMILQALGRQGRSFFSALMAHEAIVQDFIGDVKDPDEAPGNTMLEIMQHDILYMFDRRATSPEDDNTFTGQPHPELKDDQSITVHSCHSLRRELEVLHDELIKLINSGTAPQNIIVMAPDIAKAAPVINSIFGSGPLSQVYSIADLPVMEYQQAFEAFHRVISTASGRFEYTEIMSLLDMPFISSALQLDDGDLTRIGEMLNESGMRWGFSGEMHARFCGGNFEEYSCRSAIDRLLTGFACRLNGPLVGNIAPLEKIEGAAIAPFCRVVRFLEKLSALAGELQMRSPQLAPERKTLAQWQKLFSSVADEFFMQDNLHRTALAPLRSALQEMGNMVENCYVSDACPLNAALAILDDLWVLPENTSSFLRGRITFCRMVPMRSIPMEVVAVLEMNEGAFPRRSPESGFDLIATAPLPGDRQTAVQDRYLLLEALLAARKKLLFFYRGRNAKNNEKLKPCAPLSEIMTYLKNAFNYQEYEHKLSGIAPEYYRHDAPFRSMNMTNYHALQSLASNAVSAVPAAGSGQFLFNGLSCNGTLSIKDLSAFFANHAQWITRNQFGIYFQRTNEFSNDEPWVIDRKDNHLVDALIAQLLATGLEQDAVFNHLKQRNLLPPGKAGRTAFDDRFEIVCAMPEEWKQLLLTCERRPAACQIQVHDQLWNLADMVNISPDGRTVTVNAWSSCKARHVLEALFAVLIHAVSSGESVCGQILNVTSGQYEQRSIGPVSPEAALSKLTELLELAAEKRSSVLPLFPAASIYYRDTQKAAQKFYSPMYDRDNGCYIELGDATDESIRKFYTPEHWQDEHFLNEFSFWGEKVYSLMQEKDRKA